MPARANRKPTIKSFARDYFVRVNYIDIYGRGVGYDYEFILAEIKKQFPDAKTSKLWLRRMAYEIVGTVRMPMRRRSRRALAEGYAMTRLLKLARNSVLGSRYDNVVQRVREKFPEQTLSTSDLRRLENRLRFLKFSVPPRP
jgi:hypothetical protein